MHTAATQQLPRDTVQIRELQYLFRHIPTDSDKYAMLIGITAFLAMWFFNSLRKGLQPRCVAWSACPDKTTQTDSIISPKTHTTKPTEQHPRHPAGPALAGQRRPDRAVGHDADHHCRRHARLVLPRQGRQDARHHWGGAFKNMDDAPVVISVCLDTTAAGVLECGEEG